MLKRLLFLLKYYIFFVVVFTLQKPLFMLFHISSFGEGVQLKDWFLVVFRGLPLDMSMAGYITILPAIFVILSVWLKLRLIKKMMTIYSIIIIAFITIIFSVDLDLYTYWGFRFDATPLAFLKTPKEAAASANLALIIRQLIIVTIYFTVFFLAYKKILPKSVEGFEEAKWPVGVVLLLVAGCLILPIRGGFSRAVMNVGWVYFSNNMFLNHSAINPMWNFLDSLNRSEDFEGRYHFMEQAKAQAIVDEMLKKNQLEEQPTMRVLKTTRPNVILVVLESFSANVIGSLGGVSDVTPNLNQLSKEGLLFTNFYANSFRTDRGVSSILSAYPSQPQHCIMKYPGKTNNLPNIGKSLKEANYDLSFYYGGDENFTNMRSYLVNAGFERIVSEKDFSRKDYASSWGAADHVVFNKLLEDLKQRDKSKPFFNVTLTLSSHEPFTVPMPTKFAGQDNDNLYKNAVYYTDASIGKFIEEAKKQDWWDNTIIAFVSDHCYPFPSGTPMHVPERYHIVMLWLGGALKEPMQIDKIGSQNDFAVTLLSQLDIDCIDFAYSKNLLAPNSPEFACYTYNHGVGLIQKDCSCIIDLNTNQPVLEQSCSSACEKAKAYLQVSFEDFAKR